MRRPARLPVGRGPRPYHHGDLGNTLVKAALSLLNEGGRAALSLRAVAARAGVSAAAPYRHFASREALLAACAQEGFKRLEAAMQGSLRRHPKDPFKQLMDVARAYLGIAGENPAFFRVMFGPYEGGEEATAGIYHVCEKVFADLADLFKKGIKDGHFRREEPQRMALIYWGTLHGFAMLMIDKKLEDLGKGAAALIPVLEGLLATALGGFRRPA